MPAATLSPEQLRRAIAIAEQIQTLEQEYAAVFGAQSTGG